MSIKRTAPYIPGLIAGFAALTLTSVVPGTLFIKLPLALVLAYIALVWMLRIPVYVEIFRFILPVKITAKAFRGVALLLVVGGPLLPILPISTNFTMRAALAVIMLAMGLQLYLGGSGREKYFLGVIIFALALTGIPQLVKGYEPYMITTVLSATLAFLVYRYKPSGKLILYIFSVITIYLAIYYMINGSLDEAFYFEINGEEAGVSRNYVVILLLHYYFVYYLLAIHTGNEPTAWPILALPVLAIMSAGVSSTIAAMLLLGAWLLTKYRFRVKTIISIGALALTLSLMLNAVYQGSKLEERVDSGVFILSRVLLWSSFYDQLNLESVMIGFNEETTFIDHEANPEGIHNLHNSYLNLFKKVGMFSFFYFALIMFNLQRLFRMHRMAGAIYAITLIRALSDGYYYSNYMIDFVHFFILLVVTSTSSSGDYRQTSMRGLGTQR